MPATLSVITNVPDVITLFESFKRSAQDHSGFSQGFHLSDAQDLGIDADDFGWLLQTFQDSQLVEAESLMHKPEMHEFHRYEFELAALPIQGKEVLQKLTKLRDKQGNLLLSSAIAAEKENGGDRGELITLFMGGWRLSVGDEKTPGAPGVK